LADRNPTRPSAQPSANATRHFILATAGHVDHGKSSLVKLLTGTDPDRLPEEKARGITIDLGFAHLRVPSPIPSQGLLSLGIVDVPGHEDFIKNMVAGVGSIDMALLVVAADDGWMPQSEEHLQILTYLGVRRGVVALSKSDLVEDPAGGVTSLRGVLQGTPFADAPIIAVSVLTGNGIPELKSAIAQVAAATPSPRDVGKPRLPVDRVFQLQGVGTVVTGTLSAGTLERGQTVLIQPANISARIRSLQSHNREAEVGMPGTRVALNLPNLDGGTDIRRGDVVSLPGLGAVSGCLDVSLEISARAVRPLKNHARVWLHHGSAAVPATIVFFSADKLLPGERALAQLRLESPGYFFVGDRFVLRDWAAQHTLAGGTILDAQASSSHFHSQARSRFLAQREQSPGDVRGYVLSQIERDTALRRANLLAASIFGEAEIRAAVESLVAEGFIVIAGDYAANPAKWEDLRAAAAAAIDDWHRRQPERAGYALSGLREIIAEQGFPDEILDVLLGDLCARGFLRRGGLICRADHRAGLSAHLQSVGASLRAALAAKPFDPPSRQSLTPDAASQQTMRFLIESGEAVEINSEVVLAAENEQSATRMIRQFLEERGTASASELRQLLGSSRRVIIPLLERLDRLGITARDGDRRRLGNASKD
jgi:selenocysteine-specific elongation factor